MLWGDVIMFKSIRPYKIKHVGRQDDYLNTFGEEVSVANTDKALSLTCKKHNVNIKDYTVAPIFLGNNKKGGHEWCIAFEKIPEDQNLFCSDLDAHMRIVNSDYDAKRSFNLVLLPLKVNFMKENIFDIWLSQKHKYGGQNKIPRLSNDRKILKEILNILASDRT